MNQNNPEERSEADGERIDLTQGAEAAPIRTPEDVIDALVAESADLKDRLLRAVAEAENVRKRAERDRADAAKYAIAPFARDLIPVADNLARALKAVPAEQKDNPTIRLLTEGIDLVERELISVLERHGVKRIVPQGEPFNANFHQAVAELPSAQATPGTVLEVIEAGYVLGERLIRPAMVVIAKAAGGSTRETEPGGTLDTSA